VLGAAAGLEEGRCSGEPYHHLGVNLDDQVTAKEHTVALEGEVRVVAVEEVDVEVEFSPALGFVKGLPKQ